MTTPNLTYPHQAVSLYTTVCSAASHEYFPENANNMFTNRLVNPIPHNPHGRGLECALIDLFYSPSPKPAKDKIFGHEPGSNLITVINQSRSHVFVSKTEPKIENFIALCNIETKKWGSKIEFKIRITKEGHKFLLVQDEEGYKLSMSPSFSKSMGFTKSYYEKGTHEAELAFSQELFDAIDASSRMDFLTYKDVTSVETVEEPEIKTASDLITEMNKALTSHKVYFIYDGKFLTFYDEEEGRTGTMVQLSAFLSRIFGVPYPHWFHGKTSSVLSYANINLGLDAEFLLIRSNVIENQYFNGRLSNVLKLIQSPTSAERKTFSHISCVPPAYVPVTHGNVENIQISVCDENSGLITLASESHTTAVLHFRSTQF